MPVLSPDPAGLAQAAAALKAGQLVAFPTETVYGLGGDATDDMAVAKIFAVKGRPDFNPLISHVATVDAARALVEWNEEAERLTERFWPGALTLVLPRAADCPISLLASAGLDTLAVRVPGHPLARQLIEQAGCPIAAPSANKSGGISPTTADHVVQSLGDEVAGIIDGGPCTIGLESTVVDVSGDHPVLLRPGGIAAEDIEAVVGPLASADDTEAPRSPGMLSRHYAPSLPIRLNATSARSDETLLGFGVGANDAALNLSINGDLTEAAANLFAMLHALDNGDNSAIAVMPIPNQGLGRAINDRLTRAASSD